MSIIRLILTQNILNNFITFKIEKLYIHKCLSSKITCYILIVFRQSFVTLLLKNKILNFNSVVIIFKPSLVSIDTSHPSVVHTSLLPKPHNLDAPIRKVRPAFHFLVQHTPPEILKRGRKVLTHCLLSF